MDQPIQENKTLDSVIFSANNESNDIYEQLYSDDDDYDDYDDHHNCLHTDKICDECGKYYGTFSDSCSRGHG